MLAAFQHVLQYFEHRYCLPHSLDSRSKSEIKERAEVFGSEFFIARSPQHERLIDTLDLFETYSVVADISAAYFLADSDPASKRLEDLKEGPYFIVIETIFDSLQIPLTTKNIADYSPMIDCIVEAALSADYPPLYDYFENDMTWADYHPSARFAKIVKKAGTIGSLRYPVSQHEVNAYFLELLSACRTARIGVHFKRPPDFIDDLRTFEKQVISKATTESFSNKDYAFYLLAFVKFQSLCGKAGLSGITSLFHSNQLHDFCYSSPPVTFFKDGSVVNADYFPASLLPNLYLAFSIFYGIDSVIYSPTDRKIFPFAVSPNIDGEADWCQRQWHELFDALRRMRAEHT
jgi:hypothetical protein